MACDVGLCVNVCVFLNQSVVLILFWSKEIRQKLKKTLDGAHKAWLIIPSF